MQKTKKFMRRFLRLFVFAAICCCCCLMASAQTTVNIAAGGYVEDLRFDRDSPLKNLRGVWLDAGVKVFGPTAEKSGFRGELVFNFSRTFDRVIFEDYPMPGPMPIPLPASAMAPMATSIVTADIRRDVNAIRGGFRLSYQTSVADPFVTALFGKTGLDEYRYGRAYQAGVKIHFTKKSRVFLMVFVETDATGGVLANTNSKIGGGGGFRF